MKDQRVIVNQSTAARLRGVSRQSISELVAKGRFTIPTNSNGKALKGSVYLDEVKNYKPANRGRPRLTDKERLARGLEDFTVGDKVTWKFIPRHGFGYDITINGVIIKVGLKKVLLEFKDANEKTKTLWVDKKLVKVEK